MILVILGPVVPLAEWLRWRYRPECCDLPPGAAPGEPCLCRHLRAWRRTRSRWVRITRKSYLRRMRASVDAEALQLSGEG
jgi:hypothetical protein